MHTRQLTYVLTVAAIGIAIVAWFRNTKRVQDRDQILIDRKADANLSSPNARLKKEDLEEMQPKPQERQSSEQDKWRMRNVDGSPGNNDLPKGAISAKDAIASGLLVIDPYIEPTPKKGDLYYRREGKKLVFGSISEKGEFIPKGSGDIDISTHYPINLHYPILPEKPETRITEYKDKDGQVYEAIQEPGKPTEFRRK